MPQNPDSVTVYYNDSADALITGKNYYPGIKETNADDNIPGAAYKPGAELIFIFLSIFAFVLYRAIKEVKAEGPVIEENIITKTSYNGSPQSHALKYYGKNIIFNIPEYQQVLNKYCTYYHTLNPFAKEKFVSRVKEFIRKKIFIIHDEKGFKEMPILVAAASVQLSFGLDNFLLPHFKYIHIYPAEFLRTQPALCFLQGNVSGHSIRLSWKHLLQGIEHPADGQHVGLHEMAHALYYQTFVCENNFDKSFRDYFDEFTADGNKIYEKELVTAGGLYSDYAIKNFQEFWAESIEIFFENPQAMLQKYPPLYSALKTLLNQNPAAQILI